MSRVPPPNAQIYPASAPVGCATSDVPGHRMSIFRRQNMTLAFSQIDLIANDDELGY